MLRVFEAFAGYGSQSIALRNLGIEYEVVAISEIDKYAIKAYEAIHGPTNNLGDICKINPSDIPDHDLFTYSFPCQDLSVAGKQAGLGKGTRSGLLYECEKIIEAKKPKYLLLENVKNLVGKKFKPQFNKWLEYLESLGYTNYWQVLNAKHYGVPQNRERVFVVSILGDHEPYKFADKIPLDKCIADILEDEVDEKYYLSDELVDRFKKSIKKDKYPFGREYKVIGTTVENEEEKGTNSRGWVYDTNGCISTLSATDYKQPKQIAEINQVGMLDIKGNEQVRRVYGDNGISPTLNTMQGGNRQPKILEYKIYQNVKVRKYDVDIDELKKTLKDAKNKSGLTIKDISHELAVNKTTVEHWFRSDNCFSIPDEYIWLDLKKLLDITTDKFDKSIMEFEIKPNEYDMSNRAYDANGISPTLTASGESGAKKIIEYKGEQIELPCICASRGRNPENPSDRTVGAPTEQRLEFNTKGTSNTITTVQKDNYVVEPKLDFVGGIGDKDWVGDNKKLSRNYPQGNRVYSSEGIACSQTSNGGGLGGPTGLYLTDYRIRKLTPRECFRLMGMRDDDIDKIQDTGISNTQQYKMAGNSIVVDVLEAIFRNLFMEG